MEMNFKEIKDKFIGYISLEKPINRVISFSVILVLLGVIPLKYIEYTHNLSLCAHTLGKYCYSVGITRGVSSILKADFLQAWNFNPLAYLVLLVIIIIIIVDLVKVLKTK
jgi:hypothetical protein